MENAPGTDKQTSRRCEIVLVKTSDKCRLSRLWEWYTDRQETGQR